MEVILLSNIPHYHYLAEALEGAGLLKRYITSVAVSEHGTIPGLLPAFWKQKLEGRRINGVPMGKVRRIFSPELLQRALAKSRRVSVDRANYVNNHLFDRFAAGKVQRCDFLHFVSSVGLYAARRARQFGARIVCDVRQEHPRFQKRVIEAEQERLGLARGIPGDSFEDKVLAEFAMADYLFVPSGYARDTFIAEGFAADRIFVLPYGVDLRHFHPAPKSDSRFRVLFVGQLTVRKGVHQLLEAFAMLKLPAAELLLIGALDPALAPVVGRYRGLFRHIPSVPKTELRHYYGNSSVFVLPSLADAFPLVTAEAMACGLPVILSENTGTKEIVGEGREGFVVPVGDAAALAERIERLYRDSELRAHMGRRARQRALETTWTAYGDRAGAIYQSNLCRRPAEEGTVALSC